jgi:hypothetical protein
MPSQSTAELSAPCTISSVTESDRQASDTRCRSVLRHLKRRAPEHPRRLRTLAASSPGGSRRSPSLTPPVHRLHNAPRVIRDVVRAIVGGTTVLPPTSGQPPDVVPAGGRPPSGFLRQGLRKHPHRSWAVIRRGRRHPGLRLAAPRGFRDPRFRP